MEDAWGMAGEIASVCLQLCNKPRILDPLLIGELKQGRGRKYYVIHQFDLTEAEQYLADEFVLGPMELLPAPQRPRSNATGPD
jgi:hypothetical protein